MMKKNKYYCAAILAVAFVMFLTGATACGRQRAELLIAEDEEANGQQIYHEDTERTEAVEETMHDVAEEAQEKETGHDAADEARENVADGDKEQIYVYICGEVNLPGVYVLPEGARICDAVEAAGGLTDAASRDYWNLAEPLVDGTMISVPTEEEAEERLGDIHAQGQMTGSNQGADSDTAVSEDTTGTTGMVKINLNTATVEQLMTVPGIGQSKANSIVAYRQENGNFSSVEEIMNVSGIKEGLFRQMKDYIMVN